MHYRRGGCNSPATDRYFFPLFHSLLSLFHIPKRYCLVYFFSDQDIADQHNHFNSFFICLFLSPLCNLTFVESHSLYFVYSRQRSAYTLATHAFTLTRYSFHSHSLFPSHSRSFVSLCTLCTLNKAYTSFRFVDRVQSDYRRVSHRTSNIIL
jgi:hypothetical protein